MTTLQDKLREIAKELDGDDALVCEQAAQELGQLVEHRQKMKARLRQLQAALTALARALPGEEVWRMATENAKNAEEMEDDRDAGTDGETEEG